jgi:hypothetical protein
MDRIDTGDGEDDSSKDWEKFYSKIRRQLKKGSRGK